MKDNINKLEVDDTLRILEEQIISLSEKIKSGRVKDVKKEEIKLKQIRLLANLLKTHIQILEAKTLEQLTKELEEIRMDIEKINSLKPSDI